MISQFRPKIVIPTHYFIPGITALEALETNNAASNSTTGHQCRGHKGLGPIGKWLAYMSSVKNVTIRHVGHKVALPISKAALPPQLEVWVFDAAPAAWKPSGAA